MARAGIPPDIKKKLVDVLKKHGAVRIVIFGSYARGEQTRDSDLDVIVDFSGRKSLLDIIEIEQEVSDALGVKVDLLTEKAIKPQILKEIGKEMALVLG